MCVSAIISEVEASRKDNLYWDEDCVGFAVIGFGQPHSLMEKHCISIVFVLIVPYKKGYILIVLFGRIGFCFSFF